MSDLEIFKGPAFGKRHIQYVMLFALKLLIYSMRYNMSIAILAMTEKTSSNPDVPYYDWSNSNIIISSFFWGYIIPQIPAGSVGKKVGTRKLLLICMIVNSLMTLLIPLMANVSGSSGVMVCRMIQGFVQGFFFPLFASLFGRWVPVEERARVGAAMFSGATLGLVVTYPITGFLCKSWLGWPSTFYLFGALGCLWCVFYYFLGSDDPNSHKTITKAERCYIESSLGSVDNNTEELVTPWKNILSSVPVWALFFTSLGHGWGGATTTNLMPTYFEKILKIDIDSNGLLSSLPYVVSFFTTYLMGFTSDYLINNNYLPIETSRKLFTAFGSIGTGSLLLIFGFLPEGTNKYIAIGILVGSMSCHSAISSGYNINHYDLSPNFSGTIMGITNTGEELLAIVAPIATHFLVTDKTNRTQWSIIMTLGSIMYYISAVIFWIFASAQKQWWDDKNGKIKSVV